LKALVVDVTIADEYVNARLPLIEAECPYRPFSDGQSWIPNVLARAAMEGEDAATALSAFTERHVGKYHTPVAEWLYTILRPAFADQFPEDSSYEEQFDRTEVFLGIISQDLANARVSEDQGRQWLRRSEWFGRSTWRTAHRRSDPISDVAAELEAQGASWGPIKVGLFGGDSDRATRAIADYTEDFRRLAFSRF
jgi:hypothetical protein